MAKKYDLSVKTGEYTDSQGQTKGRYLNIGVMMETDKGPYILLNRTFNPAGVPGNNDRDNIMVSLFEPRDNQSQAPAQQRQAPAAQRPLNDDVPF